MITVTEICLHKLAQLSDANSDKKVEIRLRVMARALNVDWMSWPTWSYNGTDENTVLFWLASDHSSAAYPRLVKFAARIFWAKNTDPALLNSIAMAFALSLQALTLQASSSDTQTAYGSSNRCVDALKLFFVSAGAERWPQVSALLSLPAIGVDPTWIAKAELATRSYFETLEIDAIAGPGKAKK